MYDSSITDRSYTNTNSSYPCHARLCSVQGPLITLERHWLTIWKFGLNFYTWKVFWCARMIQVISRNIRFTLSYMPVFGLSLRHALQISSTYLVSIWSCNIILGAGQAANFKCFIALTCNVSHNKQGSLLQLQCIHLIKWYYFLLTQ